MLDEASPWPVTSDAEATFRTGGAPVGSVKAWKFADPGAPAYSDDFEILKRAVLQVTDIKNNNNKYYGIELHHAKGVTTNAFRVFTHYGRTDDLETNPNAGAKECRFFDARPEAEAEYAKIYRSKTGASKGYKEVALASSKIGSQRARGGSSGAVDDKTLAKIAGDKEAPEKPVPQPSTLQPLVQDLIRYIYAEATNALTTTVAAKITAHGIETPLGVLTIGQIEKGEQILGEIHAAASAAKPNHSRLESLSGEFYSAVPHRIGRTRDAIAAAIIADLTAISQKQDTLQLMKDMLAVNGEGGSVLFDDQVDAQYEALGAEIVAVERGSPEYKAWADYVVRSQVKSKNIQIESIFKLKRRSEWDVFDKAVGNERMLYHGSRIQNWVGLLTRGILMPKLVVSMGINRTDAGWLGNGIYFGDASCTSAFYTTPGKKKTRFMAIARVGLGRSKQYNRITYGLNAPPADYDSCHGVRRATDKTSQFEDDEYVIYRQNQQRLEYLVEFKL
jgi:poly [ADP-ribose] polymerase